jgi:2-polyprenyl-3-methyl-5-hydroxy-6-metoxy-1,4-benzoquinol methylase
MTMPVGEGYFANTREDLIPLIDSSRMAILDVGCGMGRLGAALKGLVPGREVHGVEMVKEAAAQARMVLDSVVVGDVQTMSLPFDPGTFDCIIFADVLEHLLDPAATLRSVRPLLRPGGVIVCSIPNMRHYTAILRLLLHGWSYDEYGLFDRTHLRFFSLASMRELLTSSGWTIESVRPRISGSRKARLANWLMGGRLEEFLALAYLICARPSS